MIPKQIQELIDKRDFQSFYEIISTSKNNIDIAWAEYGIAECWRLGGNNLPPNKSYALNYFERVLKNEHILPAELVVLSWVGKADCFRVGDSSFSRDFKLAYSIYIDLLKTKDLSREIERRLLCGKADCLRTGLIYKPGNLKEAYGIFEELLQEIHLLPISIQIRALAGKAECLRKGDINFPPQPKKSFEIFSGLESKNIFPTLTPWIKYNLAECLLMEVSDYIGDTKKSVQLCQDLLSDKSLLPSMRPLVQKCMSRGLSRKEKDSKKEKRSAEASSFANIREKLREGVDSVDPPKPAAPISSETSVNPPIKKPKPRKTIVNSDDSDDSSLYPTRNQPKLPLITQEIKPCFNETNDILRKT